MVILFRVLVTLHGVLNPPYTGNSSEWWLLFIFNSVHSNASNYLKSVIALTCTMIFQMLHVKCVEKVATLLQIQSHMLFVHLIQQVNVLTV